MRCRGALSVIVKTPENAHPTLVFGLGFEVSSLRSLLPVIQPKLHPNGYQ